MASRRQSAFQKGFTAQIDNVWKPQTQMRQRGSIACRTGQSLPWNMSSQSAPGSYNLVNSGVYSQGSGIRSPPNLHPPGTSVTHTEDPLADPEVPSIGRLPVGSKARQSLMVAGLTSIPQDHSNYGKLVKKESVAIRNPKPRTNIVTAGAATRKKLKQVSPLKGQQQKQGKQTKKQQTTNSPVPVRRSSRASKVKEKTYPSEPSEVTSPKSERVMSQKRASLANKRGSRLSKNKKRSREAEEAAAKEEILKKSKKDRKKLKKRDAIDEFGLGDEKVDLTKCDQLPDFLRATTDSDEKGMLRIDSKLVRWIRCSKCGKWRKLPTLVPFESLSPLWECSYNPIWSQNSCDVEEEQLRPNDIHLDVGQLRVYIDREKALFILDLLAFLRSRKVFKTRLPVVAGMELDLYRLYREITYVGGFTLANKNDGTWAQIFRRLDNFNDRVTDASYRLKRIYQQYLYPYENAFYEKDRQQVCSFLSDSSASRALVEQQEMESPNTKAGSGSGGGTNTGDKGKFSSSSHKRMRKEGGNSRHSSLKKRSNVTEAQRQRLRAEAAARSRESGRASRNTMPIRRNGNAGQQKQDLQYMLNQQSMKQQQQSQYRPYSSVPSSSSTSSLDMPRLPYHHQQRRHQQPRGRYAIYERKHGSRLQQYQEANLKYFRSKHSSSMLSTTLSSTSTKPFVQVPPDMRTEISPAISIAYNSPRVNSVSTGLPPATAAMGLYTDGRLDEQSPTSDFATELIGDLGGFGERLGDLPDDFPSSQFII
mmetsp:Transcript_4129/g.5581  ORF Transcript_4129/g.5581 Transcript_4129/m.5581 type:complete len:762 (+) Transcript_4129:154-2439(+)